MLEDSSDAPTKPQTRFAASIRRIAIGSLIAIPSTAATTAVLYLAPTNVAFGVCAIGFVLFSLGRMIDRPLMVGFGGVLMFGGLLSWALRQ